VLCEIAIAACDLAELLGTAIALQLLFGLPLAVGVVLTALDVLLLLSLQSRGFRIIEIIVIHLILIIGGCFLVQLWVAQPSISAVFQGFIPQRELMQNPQGLYLAVGILGATVMPHNLYLHSSIVQTRATSQTPQGQREAIRFGTIDSTVALSFAFFINAAILILSAATFHHSGHHQVVEVQDAYQLLSPLLGFAPASALFAIALLASGQNSTLTGTLAGQIVMEGFVQLPIKPWLRRLITRSLAIVPALITIIYWGESHATQLLILSQVILSLQLPFAVVPLVWFTNSRRIMGAFVNPPWLKVLALSITTVIIALNLWLLGQTLLGGLHP
jgi:manganese transport protein